MTQVLSMISYLLLLSFETKSFQTQSVKRNPFPCKVLIFENDLYCKLSREFINLFVFLLTMI